MLVQSPVVMWEAILPVLGCITVCNCFLCIEGNEIREPLTTFLLSKEDGMFLEKAKQKHFKSFFKHVRIHSVIGIYYKPFVKEISVLYFGTGIDLVSHVRFLKRKVYLISLIP